jgi:hypothetical protein
MNTEIAIRLGFFSCIFTLVAIWELLAPRRALTTSKTRRWYGNLAVVFLNSIVVRSVFTVLPVGMALLAGVI